MLGIPGLGKLGAVARRAEHLRRLRRAPKIAAIAAIPSPLKRRRVPALYLEFLWSAGRMHRFALCVLLAPVVALRRGDAAPAFVGENYDGSSVTLASATGSKGLVLWFYPKAGTGG